MADALPHNATAAKIPNSLNEIRILHLRSFFEGIAPAFIARVRRFRNCGIPRKRSRVFMLPNPTRGVLEISPARCIRFAFAQIDALIRGPCPSNGEHTGVLLRRLSRLPMLFMHVRPVAAGHFQCDLHTNVVRRDVARHAGFLYVSSGAGKWTFGKNHFPVRRGDLIAVPVNVEVSAQLEDNRPLGYYYCHFELPAGAPPECSLSWPWDLSLLPGPKPPSPIAAGDFRPEIAGHFRALQYELGRLDQGDDAQLAAHAHLMLLGATFCRMLAPGCIERTHSSASAGVPTGKGLPEPVACAVDYILAHLDKSLSLAELARVACCSERRLVGIFRQSLGTPPMSFVRQRRVHEAQRLLLDGLPIKDIANRLNFADSHHFSRVFRQTTGISPTEYAAGQAPSRDLASGVFEAVAIEQTGK
jgi:AraC-like DNA-binding protein